MVIILIVCVLLLKLLYFWHMLVYCLIYFVIHLCCKNSTMEQSKQDVPNYRKITSSPQIFRPLYLLDTFMLPGYLSLVVQMHQFQYIQDIFLFSWSPKFITMCAYPRATQLLHKASIIVNRVLLFPIPPFAVGSNPCLTSLPVWL